MRRTIVLISLMLFSAAIAPGQTRLKFEQRDTSASNNDSPQAIAVSGAYLITAGNTATGPVIRAVSKVTGEPVWSGSAPSYPVLAESGGRVFIAGVFGGGISARDAGTGAVLWTVAGKATRSFFSGRVFVANENAVVASAYDLGTTTAHDPVDGRVLWTADIGGTVAIDGFNVFVSIGPLSTSQQPLTDLTLRCYDARTGNLKWEYVRLAENIVDMEVAPNRLYVTGTNTVAFETGSGDVLWSGPGGSGIGVNRGMLAVVAGPTVSLRQAESGVLLWADTASIAGYLVASRYFADVLVGEDGVYATGFLVSQGTFVPGALRAYEANQGRVIYEDVFNPGLVLARPFPSIRDGSLVFVAHDGVFGAASHRFSVRAYDFSDVEVSRPGSADSGETGSGQPERRRIRVPD